MKSNEAVNSSTDKCPIKRPLGKTFTVFIPTKHEDSNKISSNPTVKQLARQFDYAIAHPAEHCFTPERRKIARCKRGIEATAIRKENEQGSQQEEADSDFVFKVAKAEVGSFQKPILLDVEYPYFYATKLPK